jgi:hypothetical protein
MTRRGSWWWVALAVAAGVGLVALWLWRDLDSRGDAGDTRPPPTDDELRGLRRAHAAELDELHALIASEPRLSIVGDDRVEDCWRGRDGTWGCPGAKGLDERGMLDHVGLARERWTRYRDALSSIGGHRAERDRDGRVRVTIYGAGIVTSGTSKDLLWSPAPPTPLVADTDRDRPARYVVNYAALEDDWYIEHTSN